MSTLEDAIALAVQAHRGQRDKAGAPYILHPMRVMMKQLSDEEKMTAILHDVVEDTSWTLSGLRDAGYPEAVVGAVECLTKREGENYDAFVDRVIENPIARRVKLADIEDNMDMLRLSELREKDIDRLNRYLRSWRRLKARERGA
jgi:(p)ppGpp synthase/HD superfamily hydrolase